ncbi:MULTISPECIES: FxLD family lanthipeptide [Kitasatospora]|uniref:FxLD family lanthipeptide n=1 Tax=Kitasatospora TaxID=2063 RepID=UPI00342532A3
MSTTFKQLTAALPSEVVELDLDVSIVTAGPVAAALLSSTDDGCDTVKGSDC